MNNILNRRMLRCLCLIAAILLIAAPSLWVMVTQVGFSKLTSHILISASSALFVLFVLLGIRKNNRNSLYCRIGISIGIMIAALSVWL